MTRTPPAATDEAPAITGQTEAKGSYSGLAEFADVEAEALESYRLQKLTGQNGLHEAQPPGAGEHGEAAPRMGETPLAAEGSTP